MLLALATLTPLATPRGSMHYMVGGFFYGWRAAVILYTPTPCVPCMPVGRGVEGCAELVAVERCVWSRERA